MQTIELAKPNVELPKRRRTLKILGIASALLGGASLGLAKYVKAETPTQITSQGVILPSLSNDPANPQPGQIWYNSTFGVTKYQDGLKSKAFGIIHLATAVLSPQGPSDGGDGGPNTLGTTTDGFLELWNQLPTNPSTGRKYGKLMVLDNPNGYNISSYSSFPIDIGDAVIEGNGPNSLIIGNQVAGGTFVSSGKGRLVNIMINEV